MNLKQYINDVKEKMIYRHENGTIAKCNHYDFILYKINRSNGFFKQCKKEGISTFQALYFFQCILPESEAYIFEKKMVLKATKKMARLAGTTYKKLIKEEPLMEIKIQENNVENN